MLARAAAPSVRRLAGSVAPRTVLSLLVLTLVLTACAAPPSAVPPRARLAPPDETVGAPPGAPLPYFGPARLTLGTTLPRIPANLPVWRFQVPSTGGLARAAAAHGGRGVLASARDFREPQIYVPHSTSVPAGEPLLTMAAAQPPAQAFLSQHGLLPGWPHQTQLQPSGPVAVVEYLRTFTVPGYGSAPQIDAHGTPAGGSVAVAPDGTVLEATMPAPMGLARQLYPAHSRSWLKAHATTAAPQSGSGVEPEPDVSLTSATLVYLAVAQGKVAYFEPALLLTGQFSAGGQRYQKRVLLPALSGSAPHSG